MALIGDLFGFQVHNARWWPSYDIRVQLDQDVDKGQENGITVVGEEQLKTAKVNYFGVVEQKSGEDWEASFFIEFFTIFKY